MLLLFYHLLNYCTLMIF